MKSSTPILKIPWLLLVVLVVLVAPLVAQVASDLNRNYTRHNRAFYMEPNLVNYIRPGIQVKVVSAAIAQDGTITARVTITDPKGIPLDKDGIATPGPVTLRFIAAYIPAGQTKYTAYTTTLLKATLNNNPAQTQAATDSGGVFTTNAVGDYTYTFKTKAPAGFDPGVTHSIGVSAQRDLSEFMTEDEWAETSNDVFNFVPNGSKVTAIRSVVSTSACNQCHDPLFGHGGSRLTVEMCILCHTPQTVNPDTGLTQDMTVLIHKIHMGKNLPSVQAGTPYRIWHRGAWSDFSGVGFPSGTDEVKTCTVCHQNAPQANNYLTAPSRDACGSCHDNVNFATGKNHSANNLPEISDRQCANCHQPVGELEYDASITGAHKVATTSSQLPGLVFAIISVDNAQPGQAPAVTFTVNDKAGNPVDISKMNFLNLVMTGPTSDYNGYTSEDARKASLVGGRYVYTFKTALPANASGSYAVGIEGFNNVTINATTMAATTVRDVGFNQVFYFAVGPGTAAPRRKIVSQAKCEGCHNKLSLHGGIRQNVEYCVVCHNPTVTDSSVRPAANNPPESINFKTMIHKIHTGSNLTNDFTIYGHGGSVNNYNEVGYPGDRRDCEQCHLPGTYDLPLPAGVTSQVAPRDYLTTLAPVSGACLSCHTTQSAAAHAWIMTSPTLGESCDACHGNASSSSVARVHAR
ncbi:MAG TPA: OmcA/MtrC family decaheme c-type cytochrome [Bryobacteraceae bacterium]|nr:OmcA/MtrC family decaheme c-type cytochrome [Bryobacteraceae bacterium]